MRLWPARAGAGCALAAREVALHWYVTCFRKRADFEGRAARAEFWTFQLVNTLIIGALALVIRLLVLLRPPQGNSPEWRIGFPAAVVVLILYLIAALFPMVAVAARRLHDTGRSGYALLLWFVPLGLLVLLIYFAEQGEDGGNRYGPDPRRRDQDAGPLSGSPPRTGIVS